MIALACAGCRPVLTFPETTIQGSVGRLAEGGSAEGAGGPEADVPVAVESPAEAAGPMEAETGAGEATPAEEGGPPDAAVAPQAEAAPQADAAPQAEVAPQADAAGPDFQGAPDAPLPDAVPCSGPCDDKNTCTVLDACHNGVCQGVDVTHTLCVDGDPCTTDGCDAITGCQYAVAWGTPCSDGLPCNGLETCTDDGCSPGPPPGFAPCDDGDPCTSNDLCQGTTCTGVFGDPSKACDDKNPCTADGCESGEGCTHTPISGGACEDGDPCLVSTCKAGSCLGTQKCDDSLPCTQDACSAAGACSSTPITTGACAQSETSCNDWMDNDGDGLTDCADPACAGKYGCEAQCADGQDNDGNGQADCLDTACALTAACPKLTTGDTCQDPLVVGGLPFKSTQNSLSFNADYVYPGLECPGAYSYGIPPANNGTPAPGADLVYAFSPPTTSMYQLALTNTMAYSQVGLYVVTDCAALDETCLAAYFGGPAGMGLNLKLEAGQTYFVIVDLLDPAMMSPGGGPFTLEISYGSSDQETWCSDDIDNDQDGDTDCDDAGCANTWGCETPCDDGKDNDQNGSTDCGDVHCALDPVCEPTAGFSCADPLEILTLPYTHSAFVQLYGPDYGIQASDCPMATPGAYGGGAQWGPEDAVYRFVPTTAGMYEVSLQGTYSLFAYVVTNCAAIGTTCLGANADSGPPGMPSKLTVPMQAGTAYYVIVDGRYQMISEWEGGYTLTLTKSAAADEPECQDKIDNDGDGQTDCADPACTNKKGCESACSDGSDNDGNGAADCIDSACAVKAVCDPAGVGETCASALTIGSLPYKDNRNTLAYEDDTGFYGPVCKGSSGAGTGSPDVAYAFTPATGGNHLVKAMNIYTGVSFPVAAYVVTSCTDLGSSCLGATGMSGSCVEVNLTAGTTYYIVVDGDNNGMAQAGAYTLEVSLGGTCWAGPPYP